MQRIVIPRAEAPIEGTNFRPLSQTWESIEHEKHVRRLALRPDGSVQIDTRSVYSRVPVEREEVAVNEDAIEVLVENNYKKGKFEGGYLYFPLLRVVGHESSARSIWRDGNTFCPGAFIGKHVRIEGSHIGEWSALGNGSVVKNTQIGGRTTVRHRSVITDSVIGANTHLGHHAQMARSAIGAFARSGKDLTVVDANIGAQATFGRRCHVRGPSTSIDDSFQAGENLFIGSRTVVGEQVRVGSHNHIAGNSVIGAESEFGNFVRVARGLFLLSPTYAEDGEFISRSNSPISGLDIGRLFEEGD